MERSNSNNDVPLPGRSCQNIKNITEEDKYGTHVRRTGNSGSKGAS